MSITYTDALYVGAELGSHLAFRISLIERAVDLLEWVLTPSSYREENTKSFRYFLFMSIWKSIKTSILGGMMGVLVAMFLATKFMRRILLKHLLTN